VCFAAVFRFLYSIHDPPPNKLYDLLHLLFIFLFSPLSKLAKWTIYFASINFFFFLSLMIAQSTIISGSVGLIFIHYRSGPLFPIPQATLPWQPILGKIGKNDFHLKG